nr:cytochrome P450 71AV8-like [Tanacetum cinerariifolium]
MSDRNFHNSYENQTQKISKSVFVTNFLKDSTARDLWKIYRDYGTVVDVFIPFKRSKSAKRFAFVCFIKIASLWGEYVEWEEADLKSLSCKHLCLKTNMKVIINERQKVIIQGKVRVKELDAWFPNFQEDDQDDLSSDMESQESDVANKADNNESDVDRVSESSFMHENDTTHKDVNSCKKRRCWITLRRPFQYLWFIDRWEGDTVIMGDFNEVRSKHERFGSTFNRQGAIAFNNFISSACLIDLPLEEGVLDLFPHLSALCLDRHLSDHRPILLRETNYDYGPSPFWFFHSWFAMEGFNSFVETTWKSLNIVEPNGLIRLKKKLQALKIAIKAWSKEANKRSNDRKINIQQNLSEVNKLIDQGKSDENSEYFHGIMNKKRSQLAIRRTLANGEWISEPHRVKNEFFTHFKKQFSLIQAPSICFDFTFPTHLSSDQVQDLERTVTYEEVKMAVWDCGTNKSPGPAGFSFEFYPKILANRLCVVLPYLISDVQLDFVANRQILDGPFILNELLSWCKFKKLNGMIFKVGFEKAFDSVKWDYLDKTLKAFGFGSKWRNWISSYLNNALGSVLVNGSPTLEFQFHKGLKQGHEINLHKSKLMGIGVSSNVVAAAASLIGCSNLTAPFNYLGVKLGEISAILVSSPSVAKEIMKTHDLTFADRPSFLLLKLSITTAQTSPSLSMVLANDSSKTVNLTEKIFMLMNTITCKATVGSRCKDQEQLLALIAELVYIASGFDVSDLFPSIKILHGITGMRNRLWRMRTKIDVILDDVISDHQQCHAGGQNIKENEDILDVLLRLKDDGGLEMPLTLDNIKAVILDMFVASTDTSAVTIEWTMSELIKNPRVMKKVQAEVRHTLVGKENIHELDIKGLDYLKLVIMETLRLHPPLSLLLPVNLIMLVMLVR